MSSVVVVAGAAPAWVTEQVRYAAHQLDDDGPVTVAFSGRARSEVELPGAIGPSTLLGFAPSGRAIPTARLSAALGLRGKKDTTILTVFDDARPAVALVSGLVGRGRGERVVLHDLRSDERRRETFLYRMLDRVAHERVNAKWVDVPHERSVVLAVCGDDLAFAKLVVSAVGGMAGDAVADWRFVIQSDSDAIDRIVAESPRSDMIAVERGPAIDELLDICDVVVTPGGADAGLAAAAVARGAAGIVVGHEIADRLDRRVDGVWLARLDAASLLVSLESARAGLERRGRWAPEIRTLGDQVVDAARR